MEILRWFRQNIDAFDWINLGFAVVMLLINGALYFVKPSFLFVPENDSNSSYPRDKHNVLPTVLMGGVIVMAIAMVLLVAIILRKKLPKLFREFRPITFLIIFIAAQAFSGVCITIFKNYVGRARPDLYDICGVNVTTKPESCPALTKNQFYDQFRSWPSGHSQTAMVGFFFIALFIQEFPMTRNLISTFIAALFVIFGIWCSCTRIIDYKHHTDDVLAGLFIGFLYSFMMWQYASNKIFRETPKLPDDVLNNVLTENSTEQDIMKTPIL